jgi:hypothetical protein
LLLLTETGFGEILVVDDAYLTLIRFSTHPSAKGDGSFAISLYARDKKNNQ